MSSTDTTTEIPEGIYAVDENGNPIKNADGTQKLVVSVQEIEVLDLLCEGPIEGLVESYELHKIDSNANGVKNGWDDVTKIAYEDPPNANGFQWLRSVYWNQVPLVSSDNKYNFQRINITKTEGYPNGSLLRTATNELWISRPVNERLRYTKVVAGNNPETVSKDYIKSYTVLNKECKAIIVAVKTTRLSSTDPQTGVISDTKVSYTIFYRPLFSGYLNKTSYKIKNETIRGKLNSTYVRQTRLDVSQFQSYVLDPEFIGYEIKILRRTPESKSVYIANQTFVDSITEVYQDSFLYPNCAIVRQRFSAEFFANVPQRAYECKLLKVKIPTNYNPTLRKYRELMPGQYEWDGTLTEDLFWTNNPAWCFYDLCTNKRYGLAKYVPNIKVDKFSLYEIGKYCDVLVADGYGKLEPRFTCNLIINTREEAYKVINDMASIFNAIAFYSNQSIFLTQDAPKDPIVYFSNADVEAGNFEYSSSAKKARHTVAIVRYNDPKNFYQPAVEYVEDIEGIRRYGIRELEVAAFGCTSRGQANRLGNWAILSEKLETDTVSFTAGNQAAVLRPGNVIGIYDSNRKNSRHAGRVRSITQNTSSTVVELDSTVNLTSSVTYKLHLILPTFKYESTQLEGFTTSQHPFNKGDKGKFYTTNTFTSADVTTSGAYSTITFSTPINLTDFVINESAVWVIESNTSDNTYDEYNKGVDPTYDLYRVIKIEEKEEGKYQLSCLQYVEEKFDQTEARLQYVEETPVIDIPEDPGITQADTPCAPQGLAYTRESAQNKIGSKIKLQWESPCYTANFVFLIGNSDRGLNSPNPFTLPAFHFDPTLKLFPPGRFPSRTIRVPLGDTEVEIDLSSWGWNDDMNYFVRVYGFHEAKWNALHDISAFSTNFAEIAFNRKGQIT